MADFGAERRNSHDIWSIERQNIQRRLLTTKTLNQAWAEHEARLRDIARREDELLEERQDTSTE
jgi:hypothetical protein